MRSGKWLVRTPGSVRPRARLFCFPYAGGGAFTFSSGLVAFEVARSFARHGLPLPSHLFASACPAPQYRSPKQLHRLDDQAFIAALADYQGTPPEILQDRILLALRLPVVRADFALAEKLSLSPPAQDRHTPHCHGRPRRRAPVCRTNHRLAEGDHAGLRGGAVRGGHFFLESERQPLLERVNATLRELNS